MQQWRLMLATGCAVVGLGIPTASATAQQPSPPSPPSNAPTASSDAPRAYMLRVDGQPAATASLRVEQLTGSRIQARQAGRSQRAANVDAQADVMRIARDRGLVVHELYRVRTAFNGVAVLARPSDVDALRALSGVRDVREIPLAERQHSNSVPTTRAPQVWNTAAGGNTGQGVKIGIADSGVDYVHTMFGGRGTTADLNVSRDPANNPASSTVPPGFKVMNGADQIYPTPAVVGGIDLVGDDYGAGRSWVPRPDPNPMDCPNPENANGGHGTHVAGSAAGRGVNADGSPYTGGYDSVPANLRIGPGVAPGADIYAIRIFGCGASTTMSTKAIDWALDPNGDGDPSDRLDVLNMSLGSSYGDSASADAVAAQNAYEQGLMVVIAAGNDGNRPMIVGSPGVAAGPLTVANVSTGSWGDGIEVSGAAPGSGADGAHSASYTANYPWDELAAPITAPLVRAPASNATGCEPYAERYDGQILVVEARTAAGAAFACGSVARTGHAGDAGAEAVIVADMIVGGVTLGGDAETPGAYVGPEVRTALLAALDGGATPAVTFDPATRGTIRDNATMDTVTPSSSRGPGLDGALKPEISAPGNGIVSADAGGGDKPLSMTGTSMATPHVAGGMALLRKARPDTGPNAWSVEELKALMVNTARDEIHIQPGHQGRRESPARVGSGTFDVRRALDTSSVAYAKDADGAVAVSAGRLQLPLGQAFAKRHAVQVVNKGTASQTFTVTYDGITSVPGAEWVASPGTVTVPAGESREVSVELRVPDPSALRATRDDTLSPLFDSPRFEDPVPQRALAEASGLLRLTSADERLLLPVYAALRPAAATTTAGQATIAPDSGDGSLRFDGPSIATGEGREDVVSTRMAFEWLATSPRRPEVDGSRPAAADDLRHVGVASDADTITFAAATWGASPFPTAEQRVSFAVDRDGDSEPDVLVASQRDGESDAFMVCVDELAGMAAEEPEDEWRTCVPGVLDGLAAETGSWDSRLTLARAPRELVGPIDGAREIGITAAIVRGGEEADDEVGPLRYDPAQPAFKLRSAPAALGVPGLEVDAAGELPFRWSTTRATATESRGILVLHPLGAGDDQAETVAVRVADPTPTPVPPVTPVTPAVPTPPTVPTVPAAPAQSTAARLPVRRRSATVAGARITVTGPPQCVRPGARFTVSVSGKRRSRSAAFRRIERVEFRVGSRRAATDRRAPFRQRLTMPKVKAGSLTTVIGRASVRLKSGKRMTKEIAVRVRVCG